MNKRQQGFTLIELLVVVAIIAILAATAIPIYQRYVYQSNCSSSAAEMSKAKLQVALNTNFGLGICDNVSFDCDTGTNPGELTGITHGGGATECTATLTPTYLESLIDWALTPTDGFTIQ